MVWVTYSLREYSENAGNSAEFYSIVEQLTDLTLQKAEARGIGELARQRSGEPQEELVFELLALGVFWNTYKTNARSFPTWTAGLYSRLYQLRSSQTKYKPIVDRVRGLLNALLARRSDEKAYGFTLASLRKLILWLEATCEYREEVKRIRCWETFFSTQQNAVMQLEKIAAFAAWFETESLARLGRFTDNVPKFLDRETGGRRFREDAIFCGRKMVEYHLNMVGATIMNRTFRPRFLLAGRKVVLLPLCMSSHASAGCRAVSDGIDIVCAGCTEDCRINRITELGRENGFSVLIVPHSSGFTKWLEQWRDQDHTGVVAVACVLNLLAGGYEMKSLNIPAQCVFLDYCGCKKHWSKLDIPTEIDEGRLLQIVGSS